MTAREASKDKQPPKKIGRPRKGEPQRIPYAELDKLLVFGEVVDGENGSGPVVAYPSYRELARRHGVCHSVIATYAKRYDCMRRRGLAERRVNKRVDDKLAEKRATSIAMGKADALRIIDDFIRGFEQALIENRVRMENPSDFNLMLRLKEFLEGGADSRSEVQAMFTLEDLQHRHRRILRDLDRQRAATDSAAFDDHNVDALVAGDQESVTNSPDRGFSDRSQEPTGHFGGDADGDEHGLDDSDQDGHDETADFG